MQFSVSRLFVPRAARSARHAPPALAALLALGCAAPPQQGPITPCPAPAPAATQVVAVAAPAPAAVVAYAPAAPPVTCSKGLQPASEGSFDDFEDGTSQVALADGRNGYWWLAKAPHATVDVPGPEFRVADGGPPSSKHAAHFAGKTDTQDEWGAALGGNFLGGGFYDASKYAGIGFKIKGLAKHFVRFKVHDVNTHPDGSICSKECWNAFGKTVELTGDWQTLELPFAELHQLDGWGSPRPPSLTMTKLKHLEWAIDQGDTFDFWVDDVKLFVCK